MTIPNARYMPRCGCRRRCGVTRSGLGVLFQLLNLLRNSLGTLAGTAVAGGGWDLAYWWRGGLIAALVFIGIAILIAGHHHRHHPPFPPWMVWSGARVPPPPPWGSGPPGGYGPYGGGFGQYGGRPPTAPPAPEA